MAEIRRTIEPSVYYKAEGFHFAANILFDREELKHRGAPFIVNATFALELYLKSLLSKTVFEGSETHEEGYTSYNRVFSKSEHAGIGHDLNNLYQQLSEEARAGIEKINKELSGKYSMSDFFNKNKAHFVSWRYSFEGNAEPYCAQDVISALESMKLYCSKYIVQ
ncbi:hypothetical protein K5Q02_10545 [Pseudomonas sp. MM211]|uniref:hypothetical protein n=1 Tax=Pseudomonas sp. MM211 TaxID=2866808 RepID=UPI001CECFC50|nr:hypothetical protein [Pseudomonas sp. MM211]UCJ18769.1 hypothetical protein K5Q02_10545 [Pseudomonas sp. MM211]